MQLPTLAELTDELEQYIVQHHLRKTQERREVLAELYTTHRPISADELHQQILARGMYISRGTVFNCIDLLVHSGLLLRLPQSGHSLYLLAYLCRTHSIVVCNECNRISLHECARFPEHIEGVRPRGFAQPQIVISVWGICNSCKKKAGRKKRSKISRSR